jgi:hypothetical protein
MMLKYFLCWLPMLLLAVINGAARDLWYRKYAGVLAGHQISTITLFILFGFYTWLVMDKFPPVSEMQAIYIGFFWLVLTLIFEFGFGLIRGNSWAKLLEDYNILKGRIWILIPTWITIAPWLFYRIIKPFND